VVIFQVIAQEMLSVGHGDPQLAIEKLDKALKEEKDANVYVRRIARRLRSRGLDVKYVVQKGNAGETIVAYAKNNGMGLIAMGTHGHSGMGRIIFGSIAEYVVRESGLPVLMIKPK
jgi:nucleotide-binding universal stress UspA family protein